MKKVIVLIFSILSFILLNNNQTFACSCMMPPSPSEAKEMSNSVFVGTVSDINEKKSFNSLDKYEIKLSGIKSIKGEWNDVKTVYTSQSSASCGFNFEEGKEYIVYTNGDEEENVSLCSRTSLSENANEDLEEFKNIIEVNNSENEAIEDFLENNSENEVLENNILNEKNNIYLIYLIIFTIILIIGITTFYKTKNKR